MNARRNILTLAYIAAVTAIGIVWIQVPGCGAPNMYRALDAEEMSARRGRRGSATAPPAKPGQPKTWKRSRLTPHTSQLKVGDRDSLPIKGLQAHVRVDAFRARVTLDYYYFNDRNRMLEGTFQMRLPTGASPHFLAFGQTSFAAPKTADTPVFFSKDEALKIAADPKAIMDVHKNTWRKPKEAQMVSREQAAHAYTETVRGRVDPALAEWAGAGVFNARVYPLAPKALHRIVLSYDVDLTAVGDDLELRLAFPKDIEKLAVDVVAGDIPHARITVSPDADSSDAEQRHWRFENPKTRSISVRLAKPGPVLLTSPSKAEEYFAVQVTPPLPARAAARQASHTVIMLDTSLSAAPDRFNIYLKLLDKLLTNNRNRIRKFHVLVFNVESYWWRKGATPNTPRNVRALIDFANTLSLEGATDLGAALAKAAHPPVKNGRMGPVRLFLLSDAAATWGQRDLNAMRSSLAGATLYAYNTGLAGTDLRAMDRLAAAGGGAVFSITGESALADVSRAHRKRPWRLEGFAIAGASDVLVAGRPAAIYPGQTLTLAGRGLPEAPVDVVLKLAQGNDRRDVRIRVTRAITSELAPRVYGQIAVDQIEDCGHLAAKEAVAYARHFRVTGQTCSLLMLESKADYARFGIKPGDDAAAVKRTVAQDIIARAEDVGSKLPGDPKAAFIAWLKKLTNTPGVNLNISDRLWSVTKAMPRDAFAVSAQPLVCKQRLSADASRNFRDALGRAELDYGDIRAEANRRREKLGAADALKALSNLVERNAGDVTVARDVAYSAMAWGLPSQAYYLLHRVVEARPMEPLTYLALARCLEECGKADLAIVYYEIAMAGRWPARMGQLRTISLLEYLRFLRRVDWGDHKVASARFARERLREVAKAASPLEADVVVIITWNTDRTDVDLHVTEPSGEQCNYAHAQTRGGGRLSTDVTTGFGPEMYFLRKAKAGRYRVRVKYFAGDRMRTSTRTQVYATVYQNWGRRDASVQRCLVTLEKGKQMHDITDVWVK